MSTWESLPITSRIDAERCALSLSKCALSLSKGASMLALRQAQRAWSVEGCIGKDALKAHFDVTLNVITEADR